MNKKITFLILACVFLIVGCSKKETTTLNKSDRAVVWQKTQEKSFGKFEYLDISEKEAQERMKEKFAVTLPEFYTSALPILEETLQTTENSKEKPVYSVVAKGNTLTMHGTYSYKNKQDGKYYSYATVEIIYEFDPEKKLVWLSSQDIMIFNYPGEGKVYLNEPKEALEKLAALTKLEDLKEKIDTFNKNIDKPTEEIAGKKVKVENSLKQAKEDNTVARNIGMDFDSNGTLSVIRVFVKDYTEK
ncbi:MULTISPECIES: hypothetical protein [unclassified Enterococcus]|uniref:hypothetical protein n=1 Tax=unclassified Enterococcus TaxID=2608891 RepID=UPI001CE13F2E|nr:MULTISPECIES: hypothetical protein [unclassified Enterococcus]MCA5012189.1 hypothetical protein [Enterococcus sp. S23]MCA5015440.1 hypothetical protein [Enterococcus sp. S22(2020)]